MNIGDKVHCTKYAEKTKRGISITDFDPFYFNLTGLADEVSRKEVVYFDAKKNAIESIPYDEFTDVSVDKFKMVEKEFDGIYVGTTRLSTKLTAVLEQTEYDDKDYVRFKSECFKTFAVVYYANNRKRLVPLDFVSECTA